MAWLDLMLRPNSVAAAEERWRRNNEATRKRGCLCGKPAECVIKYEDVVGKVPYEWWTCAEHEGATSFSNRVACWKHDEPCPLGEDRVLSGPIDGPTEHWSCPHRTH